MKSAIFKILLDPTDFLEYFCTGEDFEGFIQDLYGYNEIQIILKRFSLSPVYSQAIATKHKIPFRPQPEVSQKDLERFLNLPIRNSEGVEYLEGRGFPEAWMDEYQILSFTPADMFSQDLGGLESYWLFDEGEVDHREYLLKKHGWDFNLKGMPFLAIPSRDLNGNINNLAIRSVDPGFSEQVKWMFTHGRQSTFGLHRADKDKKILVVEGFFDYVAMEKLGYTAVGLGSAFPSPWHLETLKGLNLVFCMDQDDTGEGYMEKLSNTGYPIIRMKQRAKDPWEALQQYGTIELEA